MKSNFFSLSVDGQLISGLISIPDSEVPNKVVIMVHGGPGGNKNGPSNVFTKMAYILTSNGYATLRFDFRGSGDSQGNSEDVTISNEVKDLNAIISYVKELGFSSISLIGESLGGTIALLSNNDFINVIILWYPAIYLQETSLWKSIQYISEDRINELGYVLLGKKRIGEKFIREFKTLLIEPQLKTLKMPILFVHGTEDIEVPLNQSEKAYSLIRSPKSLEKIRGGQHGLRNENEQLETIELTVNWLNRYTL